MWVEIGGIRLLYEEDSNNEWDKCFKRVTDSRAML